ncbi:MAG: hypothetical protein ABIH11_07020 [Candidatus Altiarchaeota archaeon]
MSHIDPEDLAPGGSVELVVRRRKERILFNPVEGSRRLEGIEPVTDSVGRNLEGVRILLNKV